MRSKWQGRSTISKLCVTVAASSISNLSSKVEAARAYKPEFIEMRIDYLKENLRHEPNRARLSRLFDGSEILTLRSRSQGGKFSENEFVRKEIIKKFVEEYSPRFVDVELATLAKDNDLISVLKKAPATNVIGSTHFFKLTPPNSVLERIVRNVPGSLFALKIVCFARSFKDNLRLLSLYETHSNRNLIAFCMGPTGLFSRIACVSLGSPLTYSSLPGEQVAAGQLDAPTMSKILNGM